MRANQGPPVNLLNGYILRAMQEILEHLGFHDSGFAEYYVARIDQREAILPYEEKLAAHILERHQGRVVHAGCGLGTLDCMLAVSGLAVLGVEANRLRALSAERIRRAVIGTWPGDYELLEVTFPSDLPGADWSDALLVFTNVGAGWSSELEAAIIDAMRGFKAVILDLRLFGIVREEEADRQALFDRIAAIASSAERVPELSRGGVHVARFVFDR